MWKNIWKILGYFMISWYFMNTFMIFLTLDPKKSNRVPYYKWPSLVALELCNFEEPHLQRWNFMSGATSAHWGIGRTRCTEAFQKPLVQRDSKAPTFKTKEPERKFDPKKIGHVYHKLTWAHLWRLLTHQQFSFKFARCIPPFLNCRLRSLPHRGPHLFMPLSHPPAIQIPTVRLHSFDWARPGWD